MHKNLDRLTMSQISEDLEITAVGVHMSQKFETLFKVLLLKRSMVAPILNGTHFRRFQFENQISTMWYDNVFNLFLKK